jgi:hypothetical protein
MVARKTTSLSLLVGLCLLLGATLLAAEGIDGKWEGEVKTPDGNSIALTMNFKSDGAKLTGTITGPAGDVTINEGKIDGDTVTFAIDVDAGGQQMSFKCSGKLKADELNMKMDGGADLNFEFVAKRSAS